MIAYSPPLTEIAVGASIPETVIALDTMAVLTATSVCAVKLKAFGVVSAGGVTGGVMGGAPGLDSSGSGSAGLSMVVTVKVAIVRPTVSDADVLTLKFDEAITRTRTR